MQVTEKGILKRLHIIFVPSNIYVLTRKDSDEIENNNKGKRMFIGHYILQIV